jgi:hypothetical protein
MAITPAYSRLKPVPLTAAFTLWTGFSREGVSGHTAELMAITLASSRLEPVPLTQRGHLVGLALAGKASVVTLKI